MAFIFIKGNLFLFYDPLGISNNFAKYNSILTRFVESVFDIQMNSFVLWFEREGTPNDAFKRIVSNSMTIRLNILINGSNNSRNTKFFLGYYLIRNHCGLMWG